MPIFSLPTGTTFCPKKPYDVNSKPEQVNVGIEEPPSLPGELGQHIEITHIYYLTFIRYER